MDSMFTSLFMLSTNAVSENILRFSKQNLNLLLMFMFVFSLKTFSNFKNVYVILVRCQPRQSCSALCDPMEPTRLLCPWDSLEKNTGVGCLAFLQGIVPTHGLNPGLLHCLSHQGSPRILEWVAYSFSRGSSRPRN